MAGSDTPQYTFDELKEKAGLALSDPKLVEIARGAPPTSKSSVNLSWTERQALEYVLEETGNQKRADKMAKSVRFLAMMRRDYEEEFGKLVQGIDQPKQGISTDPKSKHFNEIEFELPGPEDFGNLRIADTELITTESTVAGTKRKIRFMGRGQRFDVQGAENVAARLGFRLSAQILEAILKTLPENYPAQGVGDGRFDRSVIRSYLIRHLERKFGLKILDLDRLVRSAKFRPGNAVSGGDRFTTVHFSDELDEKIAQLAHDSNTSVGDFLSGIIEVIFQDS